jgi:hypothetical protein
MEQIPCFYCGSFFDPSPRHKNQTACKKEKCQKAKKAAWQRHRMKTDPIYAANQKSSQQQWVKPIRAIGNTIARKTLKRPNGIECSSHAQSKGQSCI